MTSKISFFKLMREDMKRKTWLFVLATLVFFISLPVATLLYMGNVNESWGEGLSVQKIESLRNEVMYLFGYKNNWQGIVTFVGASLCGIFGFSYLYDKKKVDFYHSIPVRREKLFFASYLNGLLIYFVPYFICWVISILIGNGYISFDSEMFSEAVTMFLVQSVYYLLIYHAAIITTLLAGNMYGSLFLNGVLQFYAFFVYMMYIAYAERYYQTFLSWGETTTKMLQKIEKFSPAMALISGYIRLNENKPMTIYLFIVFLVSVFLLAAAVILYRIRKSEMAGKAIAFPIIQPVVRMFVVVPSALWGGWIFAEMADVSKLGWLYFGIVLGALLVHGVIEVVYQSDIHAVLSHKLQLVVSVLAAIFVTIVFKVDLFGYDTYLPKLEKIETMAINIQGLEDNEWYYVNSDEVHYRNWRSYMLEDMELKGESLESAYHLVDTAIHQTDTELERPFAVLSVKIKLKNQKEVYRWYRVPLEDCYEDLESVYNSEEYQKILWQDLFDVAEERVTGVRISGVNGTMRLPAAQAKELFALYKKERPNLKLNDLRDYPNVGEFIFEVQVKSGSFVYDNSVYDNYLYPAMTETLAYLEKIGVTESVFLQSRPKAEEIDLIRFSYDSYALEYLGYQLPDRLAESTIDEEVYEIEDPEIIKDFCNYFYFVYDRSQNDLFWDDSYFSIGVRMKPEIFHSVNEEEEEMARTVFVKVRQDQMREFIEKILTLELELEVE